jgi:hypothetical protein
MRTVGCTFLKMAAWTCWALSANGFAQTDASSAVAPQVQGEPEASAPEAAALATELPAGEPEVKVESAADTAPIERAADAPIAAPTHDAVTAEPTAKAAAADSAQPGGAGTVTSMTGAVTGGDDKGGNSPGPVSTSSISGEITGKPDRIGTGERVMLRDGDFSVIPPTGWEVYEHLNDLTLLMQMPHQTGVKYQRTIQVASFARPRYIDETTAKEYEEVITRKFAATSAAIEGYRIRNHMVIDMADGRQGLLFYSEFTLDNVQLMQAHILVSSADRHYLMTFTDVAAHIESDAAKQFFTEAWDAMISVQLGAPTPGRFSVITYGAVAAGAVLVVICALVWIRRRRAARQYSDYAEEEGDGTVQTSLPVTLMSGMSSSVSGNTASSLLPSAMSSIPTKKGRKAPETLHSEGGEPLGLDLDDDEAV